MFAFSIQNCNHSYDLIKNTNECVIAIPGERLVEHTMYCGIQSGTRVDKFKECGLSFLKSSIISTPGLLEAKANIELKIVEKVLTGDHITVIGEVMNFNVDQHNSERNLVSVGAEHEGFELLLQKGIHRLAVPLRA
jgi:flavin reductase (DIM6/NTAB) family NADH-FMN oxidoreductase RutF